VAVWSKAQVCSHLIAGVTGLNPAEGMNFVFCVSYVLCWWWLLWWADYSFRGVQPGVCVCVCVSLIVCNLETSTTGWPW